MIEHLGSHYSLKSRRAVSLAYRKQGSGRTRKLYLVFVGGLIDSLAPVELLLHASQPVRGPCNTPVLKGIGSRTGQMTKRIRYR